MKNSKKAVLVFLGIVVAATAFAQDFSQAAQAQMSKLEFLTGEWEGTGTAMMPDGKSTSNVTESITYELDNTIIRLRGVGMAGDVKVHDALGVLYYDVFAKSYKMNSWLSKGMSTNASVELLEDGKLKWWFEAGPGRTIRYTITIKDGKWNEIGEMSTDGETWRPFFEMNLTKKS